MKLLIDPVYFTLGEGHRIDEDALIGYLPSRKVETLRLSLGRNAVIRSGSVI